VRVDEKSLFKEYSNGLDSVQMVFAIKTLQSQVDYLLSQDLKYSTYYEESLRKMSEEQEKENHHEDQEVNNDEESYHQCK